MKLRFFLFASLLLLLASPFATRPAHAEGVLWGVMDWVNDPNSFPDTDTSTARPLFTDGGARMITHHYQSAAWLDFKLSQENRDEIKRVYDAGHCIKLMLYFVSCTYDEESDTFSYPLTDQFLADFAQLMAAYRIAGGPLYIQVFPEFELWYGGKSAAIQDKYRAKIRSQFEQMAVIARSTYDDAYIGLSFMGLFMADADSFFVARWSPVIANSDLVYINFMTPYTGGNEHARQMVKSTQLIHENWGKPICFPFVILWDDKNTPIFGAGASYAEDAENFSNSVSNWISRTMTAPQEILGPTRNEWRTNLASLQARGLFAFSLYSANYNNKPITPPDPNGITYPLSSYEELTGVMSASATSNLYPPGVIKSHDFIENGGFEWLDPETSGFLFWTKGGAVDLAKSPIGGQHSARLVYQYAGFLQQTIDDPAGVFSKWSISFDAAMADPGDAARRCLQLNLPHDGGNINLRVIRGSSPALGTVQFFSGIPSAGGNWVTVAVDAVDFSLDEDNLQINTFTLSGAYSGSTPAYSLTVNGDHTATGLHAWQNAPPQPGATVTEVRFETGNLAGESWAVVDNLVLTTAAPTEFNPWRLANFTADELADVSISGPDGNPTGDGIPNLLKYAFGMDPNLPASGSIVTSGFVAGNPHLTYPQARNLSDVELAVEVSQDMIHWESGESSTEIVSVDALGEVDRITVRLLPPLSDSSDGFVRVRAVLLK